MRSIGIEHVNLFQHKKALTYFNDSLREYKEIEDNLGILDVADVLWKFGWKLDEEAQYTLAIEAYEISLSLYQEMKNSVEEVRVLNLLAWVYLSTGEHQKSIELNQKALATGCDSYLIQ